MSPDQLLILKAFRQEADFILLKIKTCENKVVKYKIIKKVVRLTPKNLLNKYINIKALRV